jgi:hypothetical protein
VMMMAAATAAGTSTHGERLASARSVVKSSQVDSI